MPGLQVAGVGLSTIDVLARLEEMPTWQKSAFLGEIGFDGGGPVGTALVAAIKCLHLGSRRGAPHEPEVWEFLKQRGVEI